MKLHFNPASPYVRMVRVTACEVGLAEAITLLPTGAFTPVERHPGVAADNPLGRIPVLVTDRGEALFDTRVICRYLAHHGGDRTLYPHEPVKSFRLATLEALAHGIADSGLSLRYETAARPQALRWPAWIERQSQRIAQALDALEADWLGDLEGKKVTGASIAVAVTLSYLDFRFADMNWRDGRAGLKAFYDGFCERPSMRETALCNPV